MRQIIKEAIKEEVINHMRKHLVGKKVFVVNKIENRSGGFFTSEKGFMKAFISHIEVLRNPERFNVFVQYSYFDDNIDRITAQGGSGGAYCLKQIYSQIFKHIKNYYGIKPELDFNSMQEEQFEDYRLRISDNRPQKVLEELKKDLIGKEFKATEVSSAEGVVRANDCFLKCFVDNLRLSPSQKLLYVRFQFVQVESTDGISYPSSGLRPAAQCGSILMRQIEDVITPYDITDRRPEIEPERCDTIEEYNKLLRASLSTIGK